MVVCGDLTHRAGDAAQIAEYKRVKAMVDKFAEFKVTQHQIERRIQRRIDAAEATWNGNEWVFTSGIERWFSGDREREQSRLVHRLQQQNPLPEGLSRSPSGWSSTAPRPTSSWGSPAGR